ncbi:HAD family hydrolase [Aestuariivirga sp.]|uniref:HAD family hydrolase n=1 Tax=Aestuariivirga sp. TaxID=2650926 RepID=UPI0035B4BFF5
MAEQAVPPVPPQPRALIFDVDGTLAETEELHRRAFNETFAAHGLDWHWTKADYRRLLKVTGGKERIAAHATAIGGDLAGLDIPALHLAKTARYGALMAAGEITLRPGVQALIDAARASGLRLAIATTTSRPNVEALAQTVWGASAGAVFDVIACGDEVAAKKPAPDIYVLALHRLGLPPGRAIAFEDSRNGLQSARSAGLTVIVTPSAYTGDEDFTGAFRVLDNLSQLPAIAGLRIMPEA